MSDLEKFIIPDLLLHYTDKDRAVDEQNELIQDLSLVAQHYISSDDAWSFDSEQDDESEVPPFVMPEGEPSSSADERILPPKGGGEGEPSSSADERILPPKGGGEGEPSVPPDIHELTYIPEGEDSPPSIPSKPRVRVVASITSSREGLAHIRTTLLSLHDQDFDCIYLYIPGSYFSDSLELVPEWMRICCDVQFTPDYGLMNRLVPLLTSETDPNTILVTIENGMVYPSGMAQEIRAAFARDADSVYACEVYKFKSINYFERVTVNHNVGDAFEGQKGVAYRRGFFRNDFETYLAIANQPECCRYSDYLVVMNYLQRYKINVRCLSRRLYNANLVYPLLQKESLYTTSGLHYKTIWKYYHVVEYLYSKSVLYLRNPQAVRECLQLLASKPYGIAFCY